MIRNKVSEIMTQKVVTVPASTKVDEAASLMASKNIGSVIVAEKADIKGIFTERDVLKLVGGGKDLKKEKVTDYMTEEVVTASSETAIADAAKTLIEGGFRRLPLVDSGHIVGIVTATDLIFEMNSQHASGLVSDYMTEAVETIGSGKSLKEAVDVMLEKNIGSLIVSDKTLKGILTERDILRAVARGNLDLKAKVSEAMSSEVVAVDADTQVSHACYLMYYNGIRRLPIVDSKGELIGIVTERDLLKALKPSYEVA